MSIGITSASLGYSRSASDLRYLGKTGVQTLSGGLDINELSLAGSGSLSGSALNIATTWNTTGTPTAIKLNVTDTASNASSLLMDLRVGGTSKISINKGGNMIIPQGSGGIWFSGNAVHSGIRNTGYGLAGFEIVATANRVASFIGDGFQVGSGRFVGFRTDNNLHLNAPTRLYGEGDGILAQRNSTNPQTFRLYNTYTDASNYERLSLKANAGGAYTITSEAAGTGVLRNIALMGGNVGIGTITPSEKLTVVGNISASGAVTGTNLVYNSGDQTIAGVKTFSNNIVGNGVDNTLPTQTITSSSHILTRGLGDLRYSPSFEKPITTDTIAPITEQFEDFVNSYGDLVISNSYGAPNLTTSPVFGDNWSGSNILGSAFSGNDEYTQHGVVLVRGPASSNTCSYMFLNKPCRLDSNGGDSSELTIRMFLNISGFESETYFGIGCVPIGGTGAGDAALLGGLIYNPYINPNYLILAASSTGGTSPYLFKTAPSTYAYQTTSIPISALVNKWWNLKYSLDLVNGNITVSAIREGVTVYTDTFTLNSTNFGDRYYYLYGIGASRQIGFTFGRFNYATNRTQVYFDYWRYSVSSTKTFPINWNSLRF